MAALSTGALPWLNEAAAALAHVLLADADCFALMEIGHWAPPNRVS